MSGWHPPTSQCTNLELITRFTSTEFESKIQDFFQSFFKTIISFSRLKVIISWSIQALKNTGKKLFHNVLQMYGRDWKRFDQNGKNFTYKALAVALKKQLMTFYHVFRFYLYFLDFFQVWKIAAQISGLSLEFIVQCISITKYYTNVYHGVNCMRRHIQASNTVNCFNNTSLLKIKLSKHCKIILVQLNKIM